MNKRVFSLMLIVLGTLSITSCSSDSNEDGGEDKTKFNRETNSSSFMIMQDNYYWSVPTNIDNTLDPTAYFNKLLDKDVDKYTIGGVNYTYSRIYAKSNLSSTSYDIGFEYGINNYLDVYNYTIYYVKPGTDAATQRLKRGLLIEEVNGVKIPSDSQNDLLRNAYKNGAEVSLKVRDLDSKKIDIFKVKPVLNYTENPILVSKTITTPKKNEVAYIVYNKFVSGPTQGSSEFDNQLISKLAGFVGQSYLVLDLRYNANGLPASAQKLGDAIVKESSNDKPFIYVDRRSGQDKLSYPFITTSASSLSNTLKKVYVIVGANTGGVSEAFINALKVYLPADLYIVGQATQGRNLVTGSTETSNKAYQLDFVIGKWTNASNESYVKIEPSAGFEIAEPEMLEALGSSKEAMLAKIISDIDGTVTKSTRSGSIGSNIMLGSSILEKLKNSNANSISLE